MSRAKKKPERRLSLPPLPNQAALDRAMAAIRKMSPQEIFETSVRSGIYTPEGQLTESFGGPPAKKKARAKKVAKRKGSRIVGDIVNFSEPEWLR
jgi:hypothetical protein